MKWAVGSTTKAAKQAEMLPEDVLLCKFCLWIYKTRVPTQECIGLITANCAALKRILIEDIVIF